uniref:Dis3-like exonuclease 2 n=1 Tax=Tetraselmis sp. GSL018 TaxID=582737 RepID=A0A061SEE0_9CHLO
MDKARKGKGRDLARGPASAEKEQLHLLRKSLHAAEQGQSSKRVEATMSESISGLPTASTQATSWQYCAQPDDACSRSKSQSGDGDHLHWRGSPDDRDADAGTPQDQSVLGSKGRAVGEGARGRRAARGSGRGGRRGSRQEAAPSHASAKAAAPADLAGPSNGAGGGRQTAPAAGETGAAPAQKHRARPFPKAKNPDRKDDDADPRGERAPAALARGGRRRRSGSAREAFRHASGGGVAGDGGLGEAQGGTAANGGTSANGAAAPRREGARRQAPGQAIGRPRRAPARKQRFKEYWMQSELQEGMKSGKVFRATFRCNAKNRSEGYVSIPGIPVDMLIKGSSKQNRAVPDDEVAVLLLGPEAWHSVEAKRGDSSGSLEAEESSGIIEAEESSGLAESPGEDEAPEWGQGEGGGSCGISKAEALDSAVVMETEAEDSTAMTEAEDDTGADEAEAGGAEGRRAAGEDGKAAAQLRLEEVVELLVANPNLRPTGQVVGILSESPRRERIIGSLTSEADGVATLMPSDPRMPKMSVRVHSLPASLRDELLADCRKADGEPRRLVSARIAKWSAGSLQPLAQIRESIGQAGEIESETAAILAAEGIVEADFPQDALDCLPAIPWSISEDELAKRRDFRPARVFTIDPLTARDLDDALSVEALPGGLLRIGVHIADVSHFVKPQTPLDEVASQRSTSVYLVQRVLPMLPHLLCQDLCSLNPGTDRLAFSIVWDMTPEGEVRSQWIGRSVIRSCVKLAYEHAQRMIEGSFTGDDASEEPIPCELQPPHTWDQVVGDVRALHGVAKKLRAARFENGALRLDNIRLVFRLDENGNPTSVEPHVQREANQTIEEFMLLANKHIAEYISRVFPDRALLRKHSPPDNRLLVALEENCKALGIAMDISSSGTIYNSLLDAQGAVCER